MASKIDSTDNTFSNYLHNPNSSSFFLTPTNPYEIIQLGKELKYTTSCGSDDIAVSAVKAVIASISIPLA